MTFTPRTRFVNPRLGTYFGIFASALAALFFMAAILEQLGISDTIVRWMMLLGPVALYGSIGMASATRLPLDASFPGMRMAMLPYQEPGVGGCLLEFAQAKPHADGVGRGDSLRERPVRPDGALHLHHHRLPCGLERGGCHLELPRCGDERKPCFL